MLQAKWTPRCPDEKEVQISLHRLHACSSFISQDERMSESPVVTLEKALGLHFISKDEGMTESHVETLEKAIFSTYSGECASHSFHTLRGALSLMLKKVTMPDSS